MGAPPREKLRPLGITDNSITGISFSSSCFKLTPYYISSLDEFNFKKASEIAGRINQKLTTSKSNTPEVGAFGFLLIDGLSQMEERVLAYLSETLVTLPIFGGSAADDLGFKETYIFKDDQFVPNAAVLVLVETTLTLFCIQSPTLC